MYGAISQRSFQRMRMYKVKRKEGDNDEDDKDDGNDREEKNMYGTDRTDGDTAEEIREIWKTSDMSLIHIFIVSHRLHRCFPSLERAVLPKL
jgi:hypothetical protein